MALILPYLQEKTVQKPLSFLPTFKAHNIALLVLVLLLGGMVYWVNIKRTLISYQSYQKQKQDISRAANATANIQQYRAQLVSFQETALQAYDREYLLERLTGFCRQNSILIKAFPEADRVLENEVAILSNTVEVEGRYQDIAQLVYMIEQEEKLGAVSSLKFFSEKDRRTKSLKLLARIVIRNLE